jgi:hypothetical protein
MKERKKLWNSFGVGSVPKGIPICSFNFSFVTNLISIIISKR